MKKYTKLVLGLLSLLLIAGLTACSSFASKQEGNEIITAKEAIDMVNNGEAILVDAQNSEGYMFQHIDNAISISRSDITISEPVSNMLAPKETIQAVLEDRGITNDDTLVVYDSNNNMDSARLWWTLKVYGFDNVKVVSGGKAAMLEAGAVNGKNVLELEKSTVTLTDADTSMIATMDDVLDQVNDPEMSVRLIDTRSLEEYEEGTIPSSTRIEYLENNNEDGTYKTVTEIQTKYLDQGIIPETEAILYCKTSIRGAQTYLALYNAGYTNLKLYDGAWVEWSSYDTNPIEVSEKAEVDVTPVDAS